MLTDVAGLGLALKAIQFAERAATPERTYGFYRVEIPHDVFVDKLAYLLRASLVLFQKGDYSIN
jgi:cobalt-zinc-cadmium efflux system protein